MGEYYDFGTNLSNLLGLWYGHPESDESGDEDVNSIDDTSSDSNKKYQATSSITLTSQLLQCPAEARTAICVAGLDREQVQYVKNTLATLVSKPIPLESFHVKKPGDIAGGALLVPKVVLVANHIPGKLLIDGEGDTGQLDYIYDELVETGADILVVYMGLPETVYPAMRHMIYHPRMIDIVFPDQPILRELAEENCLITTVGNTDFTNMQKNLMKEWVSTPITSDHPVFKHAAQLNPLYDDDTNFWSETEIYNRNWYPQSTSEPSYKSATEEHPLADKKKKKKRSKFFKIRKKKEYKKLEEPLYDELEEDLEMEMYRQTGYSAETFSQLSV